MQKLWVVLIFKISATLCVFFLKRKDILFSVSQRMNERMEENYRCCFLATCFRIFLEFCTCLACHFILNLHVLADEMWKVSLVSFEIIEQAWKIISSFSNNRVLQTPGWAVWSGNFFNLIFFFPPVAGSCLEKCNNRHFGYSKPPYKTSIPCGNWTLPYVIRLRQKECFLFGGGGPPLGGTAEMREDSQFGSFGIQTSFLRILCKKWTFFPPTKVRLFQMSQIKRYIHLCRGYLEMCSYVEGKYSRREKENGTVIKF